MNGFKESEKMYGMWTWKVLKWPWFLVEVAAKAWRDLATLVFNYRML
jgi:hypothetical protein